MGALSSTRLRVKQNDSKALEWAFHGAKLGDAHAQTYAGYLLGTGRGAKQDDEQALRWHLHAGRIREDTCRRLRQMGTDRQTLRVHCGLIKLLCMRTDHPANAGNVKPVGVGDSYMAGN